MKKRLLLLALPLALVSVACAPNAGALPVSDRSTETPTLIPATSQPSTGTRLASVEATTQALAPVTRPVPTRTAPTAGLVPRPGNSTGSGPTVNAPAPLPTATRQPTATAVRFDPNATPTPLWSVPPKPIVTATPTAIPVAGTAYVPPQVVAAAPGDQFVPQLNHQYTLPTGWSEVKTDSSRVLYDPSGKISITITEHVVEPWKYPTALALGTQLLPSRPSGWEDWVFVSSRSIRSGNSYEFRYTGIKDNHTYTNFIQWYMWGDVHVQVSAEVPEFDWNASSAIRSGMSAVMNSFEPHDNSKQFTESEAMGILEQRLDERASGIYARDNVILARYEMTCNQIFTDLIQGAVHFGAGIWQMSAQALEGTETWRVFEPSGSVVALGSNKSRC